GLLFVARYRLKDFTAILILAVTAYLSLRHIRHALLFLVAFGAYFPATLDQFFAALGRDGKLQGLGRRVGWKIPALVLCLISLWWIQALAAKDFLRLEVRDKPDKQAAGIFYPVGALEFIKTKGLKGNLLPRFDWGEFLLWNLHPGCLVGMDGRYETVYSDQYARKYFDFLYARKGWSEFLTAHAHEMVLITPASGISRLMAGLPQWRQVYRDRAAVLFVKKGSRPDQILAQPPG
ncbi:MAG: hypothetical protein PVG03_19260, partial [Desulfarculaceae bacterium]